MHSGFFQALVASIEKGARSDDLNGRIASFCETSIMTPGTFLDTLTSKLRAAGFRQRQRSELLLSARQFVVAASVYDQVVLLEPGLSRPMWENMIISFLSDPQASAAFSPRFVLRIFRNSARFRRLVFHWFVRHYGPLRREHGLRLMGNIAQEDPSLWLFAWMDALLHGGRERQTSPRGDAEAADIPGDSDDPADPSADSDPVLAPLALMTLLHSVLQERVRAPSFLQLLQRDLVQQRAYVSLFVTIAGLLSPIELPMPLMPPPPPLGPSDALRALSPVRREQLFLAAQDEKVISPLSWCVVLLLPTMVSLGPGAFRGIGGESEEEIVTREILAGRKRPPTPTVDISDAEAPAATEASVSTVLASSSEDAPPLLRFVVAPTLRLLRCVVDRVVGQRASSHRTPFLAGVLNRLLLTVYSLFPCSLLLHLRTTYVNRKARGVMGDFCSRLTFNPDLFRIGGADAECSTESWASRLSAERVPQLVDRYVVAATPAGGLGGATGSPSSPSSPGHGKKKVVARRSSSGLRMKDGDARLSKERLWEKIADVQDWIDRFHFHAVSFQDDGRRRQRTGPEQAIGELQTQLLVLKNELLYERFLKNEYLQRFLRLRGQQADRAHHDSGAKIRKRLLEEQSSQVSELREALRLSREEMQKQRRLRSTTEGPFFEEMRRLSTTQDENVRLADEARFLRSGLTDIRREKTRLEKRVYDLETEMAATRDRIGRFAELSTKSQHQAEEIQMWEGNYQRFKHVASRNQSLTHQLVLRDEVIASMSAKVQSAQATVDDLMKSLHLRNALLNEMKQARAQAKRDTTALKGVMQQQLKIAEVKIAAIQEKYRRVKKLNVFLSEKMFRK